MVINLSFFREKTPDLSGDGAYKLRGNPTRDAPLMNRGQGLEKHSRSGKILQSSNTKATFPQSCAHTGIRSVLVGLVPSAKARLFRTENLHIAKVSDVVL